MSLIRCFECKKKISIKADVCPNCGCPMNKDYIKELNETLNDNLSISAKNMCQAYALRNFFYLAKESGFITPALLNSSALESVLKTINPMNALAKEIAEE